MKSQITHWNGTTVSAYHLDRGEKLLRHQHPLEHTTVCLQGSVHVEVFDGSLSKDMSQGDPFIVLRANVDHEITSNEDGTIILNVIEMMPVTYHPQAGVMLAEGIV